MTTSNMTHGLIRSLKPHVRAHGTAAALSFGVPAAIAAYEAPHGKKGEAVRDTVKWTALGTIPGAAVLRDPRKALASAFGAGLATALQITGGYESDRQARKTRALIEALGRKVVPREVRKIEQAINKESLEKGAGIDPGAHQYRAPPPPPPVGSHTAAFLREHGRDVGRHMGAHAKVLLAAVLVEQMLRHGPKIPGAHKRMGRYFRRTPTSRWGRFREGFRRATE